MTNKNRKVQFVYALYYDGQLLTDKVMRTMTPRYGYHADARYKNRLYTRISHAKSARTQLLISDADRAKITVESAKIYS